MTCSLRLLLLGAVLVLLGIDNAPLTLSLRVDRTSFDVLDTVAIRIVTDNRSTHSRIMHFPSVTEYAITVTQNDYTLWTSLPKTLPATTLPPHTRALQPGASVLGTYIWDGLARDGASLRAGTYTINVRLLADGAATTASTRITFVPPLPVATITHLPIGDAVTVGGHLDGTHQTLIDTTGSVQLSQRLRAETTASIVVRGYVTARADGTRALTVTRWAVPETMPAASPTP